MFTFPAELKNNYCLKIKNCFRGEVFLRRMNTIMLDNNAGNDSQNKEMLGWMKPPNPYGKVMTGVSFEGFLDFPGFCLFLSFFWSSLNFFG